MKRLDEVKPFVISIPREAIRIHEICYAEKISSKFKEQEYYEILRRKIETAVKKKRGKADTAELNDFFNGPSI